MTSRERFQYIVFVCICWFFASVGNSFAAAAQLTLNWRDNSTNESGFAVERKTGTAGAFAEIVRTAANVVSYTDANLAAGTTYCYRVRAFNATQHSAYSNESCGTTALQSFTLTVNRGGTGSGTVSSTPAGINCGTDCSEAYPQGTTVTLTAAPAAGSVFSGWSEGSCGRNTTCTVSMTSNLTVAASFIIPPRLVAAYSFDEGSGTTVTDASGNNNTGTIADATWTTQGKFG
ncbi:MAG: fibronectin type III domain-containing protein, partial [Candidatus Binatia bacterium]|nr:fibronectin type III domain-containing protein [Candidatus Binatia bacterium]